MPRISTTSPRVTHLSAPEIVELIEGPTITLPGWPGMECRVLVRDLDTLGGARLSNVYRDRKDEGTSAPPLILAFAHPTTPCAGTDPDPSTQEGSLCLATSLPDALITPEAAAFYDENSRADQVLFSHGMLLSPHVEVYPQTLSPTLEHELAQAADGEPRNAESLSVAVLSVAAPMGHELTQRFGAAVADSLIKTRIMGMLMVAVRYGYDRLVLGAWGCGACGNDPARIARAFRQALDQLPVEAHVGNKVVRGADAAFSHVVFAVPDSASSETFAIFKHELGEIRDASRATDASERLTWDDINIELEEPTGVQRFCTQCGAALLPAQRFCTRCGTAVENQA